MHSHGKLEVWTTNRDSVQWWHSCAEKFLKELQLQNARFFVDKNREFVKMLFQKTEKKMFLFSFNSPPVVAQISTPLMQKRAYFQLADFHSRVIFSITTVIVFRIYYGVGRIWIIDSGFSQISRGGERGRGRAGVKRLGWELNQLCVVDHVGEGFESEGGWEFVAIAETPDSLD